MRMGDSSQCGHVTLWKLDTLYDVTSTKGCSSLGLIVADSAYTLIKVDRRHSTSQYIIMSEMKSNPLRFVDQVTHFTPKLKRCGSEPVRWAENYSLQLRNSGTTIHNDPNRCIITVATGVALSILFHSISGL